ncbi:hypothetical protein [Serratia fonticola]|uniref:hypothetical protein n=1 Tax=Serratia fonticola TaxID=47917 RepID=UPI00301E1F9E
MNWPLILALSGFYLQLGYCHSDTMRELGLLRRSPRFVGFVVIMLLWPIGVMMLADRIRACNEWSDRDE